MGNRYSIKRENFTPTAANDTLTIISASTRRVRVLQVTVGGLGTTSAAQQINVSRSTVGTTPGGAITPSKFEHTEQPAMVSTTATTWATQPTLETNGVVLGWNALGGSIIWNAPAGGNKIEARNGENISIRAPSGPTYQACSVSAIIEED